VFPVTWGMIIALLIVVVVVAEVAKMIRRSRR
jgi:hypothetical protein